MTTSPIWGHAPTEPIITKFGVRGLVGDLITGDKFCRDRLRGFRSVGVRKWGSSIDLSCRPYNRSALPCCLWSFWRQVFPGNQLHWYWQPKTGKQNTTYTRNTKEKQKKNSLASRTIYTMIWYAFYDLWPGNGLGRIFTTQSPQGAHICGFTAIKFTYWWGLLMTVSFSL